MHSGEHFSLFADHSPSQTPSSQSDVKGLALHTDGLPPRKSVQETVESSDAATGAAAGRCCTRIFLPLLIVLLATGIFALALLTGGRAPVVDNTPRAALFIFEGFKGTAFERLLASQRLPHIQKMLNEQHGVHAACTTTDDIRCAHAVPVKDTRTGESYVSSGAGIASILTGVTPLRHRVREDSWASYHALAVNAGQYPSVALRVTRAGKRVAAVGAPHLLHSLHSTTGQCSYLGVLDAECERPDEERGHITYEGNTAKREVRQSRGEYTVEDYSTMNCLKQSSCNLHKRILLLSNGATGDDHYGVEERRFTETLTEFLGSVVVTGEGGEKDSEGRGHASGGRASSTPVSMDSSLLIFHFNALARRAGDSALPEFTYDTDSLEYTAQAFLLDSFVGQVLALLRSRALAQKENWLVVGTSDHGGSGKSFGSSGDVDEVVPFFVATYTTNRRGYVKLGPLQGPVTHMDAAPTILRWLGIAPYDGPEPNSSELHKTAAGRNTSAPVWPLDGRPQGICGSGKHLQDCAVVE